MAGPTPALPRVGRPPKGLAPERYLKFHVDLDRRVADVAARTGLTWVDVVRRATTIGLDAIEREEETPLAS